MHKNKKTFTQTEHHQSVRLKKHKKKSSDFIDKLIVFSGPLIPVAVSFQAYSVIFLKQTEGLSIVTWTLLLFSSITMSIYAIHHKIMGLMLTYMPLVVLNLAVVVGIVLYSQ